MAAEEGDCKVQVANALTGDILCTLELPKSSTVLEVKRRVQAAKVISIFRQRLIISPAGPQVEDHEVLGALSGLRLQLLKLEYTDGDEDEVHQLLRAAGLGVVAEVERLLRLPLRPDCMLAEDGVTALIIACEEGHLEVARLLCEAGADKDKAMQDGATALILVSASRHLEVARLLCEAGADKDKTTQDGATALIYASQNGHLELAQLLPTRTRGPTLVMPCRTVPQP